MASVKIRNPSTARTSPSRPAAEPPPEARAASAPARNAPTAMPARLRPSGQPRRSVASRAGSRRAPAGAAARTARRLTSPSSSPPSRRRIAPVSTRLGRRAPPHTPRWRRDPLSREGDPMRSGDRTRSRAHPSVEPRPPPSASRLGLAQQRAGLVKRRRVSARAHPSMRVAGCSLRARAPVVPERLDEGGKPRHRQEHHAPHLRPERYADGPDSRGSPSGSTQPPVLLGVPSFSPRPASSPAAPLERHLEPTGPRSSRPSLLPRSRPRRSAQFPHPQPGDRERENHDSQRDRPPQPERAPRQLRIPDRSLLNPVPPGNRDQPRHEEFVCPVEFPELPKTPRHPAHVNHHRKPEAAEIADG